MINIKAILEGLGVEADKIQDATTKIQTAVDAELLSGNMIPKSRFDAIYREKKELDGKLAEMTSEIETLNQQLESNKEIISQADTYKQELESFKKTQYENQIKAWKEKEAFFRVDKNHKDYERRAKLMAEFSLSEEGKELTAEQIASNIKQFNLLEKAGAIDFKAQEPEFKNPPPIDKKTIGKSLVDIIKESLPN
jgi:uncharacterized phage infection (PIP) family protein YhgE